MAEYFTEKYRILPVSHGASSATKITDYYYYQPSWGAPFFGGMSDSGLEDGVFLLYRYYNSTSAFGSVGSHIQY